MSAYILSLELADSLNSLTLDGHKTAHFGEYFVDLTRKGDVGALVVHGWVN